MFRSRSRGDLHTGSAALLGWPSTLSLRLMRLFARAVRAATVHRCWAAYALHGRQASALADEIGHGGSDGIGLLDDHEMPGARDIDDLHPLAQLLAQRVSVGGRGDDVIETLDHQERSVAASPPFVPWHSLAGRQVCNVNLRPALD